MEKSYNTIINVMITLMNIRLMTTNIYNKKKIKQINKINRKFKIFKTTKSKYMQYGSKSKKILLEIYNCKIWR